MNPIRIMFALIVVMMGIALYLVIASVQRNAEGCSPSQVIVIDSVTGLEECHDG